MAGCDIKMTYFNTSNHGQQLVYEWKLHTTLTFSNSVISLLRMQPYLSPLIRAGEEVIDQCCASGPMIFWFKE
jgi:hypothetical protein